MTINPRGRLLQGFDAESGDPIHPPMSHAPFRPSRFKMLTCKAPTPASPEAKSWNGWAVPYFRKDEAIQSQRTTGRVAKEIGGDMAEARAHYDEATDSFQFFDPIFEETVCFTKR